MMHAHKPNTPPPPLAVAAFARPNETVKTILYLSQILFFEKKPNSFFEYIYIYI
jgi:hypothetical protein